MRTPEVLIFLCFELCTQAQIQSSCNVPIVLQNNYDEDVKHLALERIFSLNSAYKDSIVIPQSFQDTIWEGLAAIFNLTTVPERDSAFDKFCIHQLVKSISHGVIAWIDTAYSWTHQWWNLNTVTGIAAIDSLVATYSFKVIDTLNIAGSYFVLLTTPQSLNAIAFCDSLVTFGGVIGAQPNNSYCDGNRITYSKSGTDRYYDFAVGFGDCPAGCTSFHIFRFKVYDNCSVDYLGTFDYITPGDRMPLPVNCNITTTVEKVVASTKTLLFPNPFYTTTTLQIDDFRFANYDLRIYDMMGRLVREQQIINHKSEIINRDGLSDGLYFYELRTTNYELVDSGKFVVK